MTVGERREHLRRALLDAGERAIVAEGLAGLRARDLAHEANCAVSAIYTAYPDLDALVLAVNLRTLAVFETYIAAEKERSDAEAPRASRDAALADLVGLALTYLAFANEHRNRWRALFQHRMSGGRVPPASYIAEQARLFAYIEGPLRVLRPELEGEALQLTARTLFSATHGIVSLGLDEKLMPLPLPVLSAQLTLIVRATGLGLANPG